MTTIFKGAASEAEGGLALKTILVVEDNDLIRDCLVLPLKKAGYQILAAVDGVEGAVLFARHFDKIDLLLTDISMPGMKGTDLARFARKIRSDVEVIFASGSLHLECPNPTTYIEGAMLLNKPFTIAELLCSVEAALSKTVRSGGEACGLDARPM